jgi:hypothetical protein
LISLLQDNGLSRNSLHFYIASARHGLPFAQLIMANLRCVLINMEFNANCCTPLAFALAATCPKGVVGSRTSNALTSFANTRVLSNNRHKELAMILYT